MRLYIFHTTYRTPSVVLAHSWEKSSPNVYKCFIITDNGIIYRGCPGGLGKLVYKSREIFTTSGPHPQMKGSYFLSHIWDLFFSGVPSSWPRLFFQGSCWLQKEKRWVIYGSKMPHNRKFFLMSIVADLSGSDSSCIPLLFLYLTLRGGYCLEILNCCISRVVRYQVSDSSLTFDRFLLHHILHYNYCATVSHSHLLYLGDPRKWVL